MNTEIIGDMLHGNRFEPPLQQVPGTAVHDAALLGLTPKRFGYVRFLSKNRPLMANIEATAIDPIQSFCPALAVSSYKITIIFIVS